MSRVFFLSVLAHFSLSSLLSSMAHNHAPNTPANLAVHSGAHAGSTAFAQNNADFNPNLTLPLGDLHCAACCWTFLVNTRNYAQAQALGPAKVFFNNPTTSCVVDGPQGHAGVHSVISTGHDLNLGVLGPRPTQGSKSYQLYLPAGVNVGTLAVGAPIAARIESISSPQLHNAQQLNDCYFNYADAALIELCLQRRGVASFQGTCTSPPQVDVDDEADEVVVLGQQLEQVL